MWTGNTERGKDIAKRAASTGLGEHLDEICRGVPKRDSVMQYPHAWLLVGSVLGFRFGDEGIAIQLKDERGQAKAGPFASRELTAYLLGLPSKEREDLAHHWVEFVRGKATEPPDPWRTSADAVPAEPPAEPPAAIERAEVSVAPLFEPAPSLHVVRSSEAPGRSKRVAFGFGLAALVLGALAIMAARRGEPRDPEPLPPPPEEAPETEPTPIEPARQTVAPSVDEPSPSDPARDDSAPAKDKARIVKPAPVVADPVIADPSPPARTLDLDTAPIAVPPTPSPSPTPSPTPSPSPTPALATQRSAEAPGQLTVSLLAHRGEPGQDREVLINRSSPFHTDDRYAFTVTSTVSGYLGIFELSSKGQLVRLFPIDPELLLSPQVPTRVPADYVIGGTTTRERLIVVAMAQQVTTGHVEALLDALARHPDWPRSWGTPGARAAADPNDGRTSYLATAIRAAKFLEIPRAQTAAP